MMVTSQEMVLVLPWIMKADIFTLTKKTFFSLRNKTDDKPKLKQVEHKCYYWDEIDEYIRKKYLRDLRDWSGKWVSCHGADPDETQPYQDFWHWMCDHIEIQNDSFVTLWCEVEEVEEPWVQEILTILRKEFFEGSDEEMLNIELYVSW